MGETIKYVRWECQIPKVRDLSFKLSCMPCGIHEINEPIIYDERPKWKPESTGYGRVCRRIARVEFAELDMDGCPSDGEGPAS